MIDKRIQLLLVRLFFLLNSRRFFTFRDALVAPRRGSTDSARGDATAGVKVVERSLASTRLPGGTTTRRLYVADRERTSSWKGKGG